MRENRRGEMALRVARMHARRSGDRELAGQITDILRDTEHTAIAGVALEDEASGGGGLFRDILKWIVENPQQFKDLITFIVGLFTGISSSATVKPTS